jgi:hypothetical protein
MTIYCTFPSCGCLLAELELFELSPIYSSLLRLLRDNCAVSKRIFQQREPRLALSCSLDFPSLFRPGCIETPSSGTITVAVFPLTT